MKLISANHSSYPKIGFSHNQQKHRKAYADFEVGKITKEEFDRIQNQVIKEVINQQIDTGIEIITDGMIKWYDPISHFLSKFENVKINGLVRFFDTNFLYRQPIFNTEFKQKENFVVDEFKFANSICGNKTLKPVITGPYTLAKFSVINKLKFETVVMKLSDSIANEIKLLENQKAKIIQIEEPAIGKYPQDYKIFESAIKNIPKTKSRLSLTFYFTNIEKIFERLQELPVDILGIDFTYNPNLIQTISKYGSNKSLAIGLLDGRNTRLENQKDILNILEKMLKKIKTDCYLTTSCGLEYLPQDKAQLKLKLISKITKKWQT